MVKCSDAIMISSTFLYLHQLYIDITIRL